MEARRVWRGRHPGEDLTLVIKIASKMSLIASYSSFTRIVCGRQPTPSYPQRLPIATILTPLWRPQWVAKSPTRSKVRPCFLSWILKHAIRGMLLTKLRVTKLMCLASARLNKSKDSQLAIPTTSTTCAPVRTASNKAWIMSSAPVVMGPTRLTSLRRSDPHPWT